MQGRVVSLFRHCVCCGVVWVAAAAGVTLCAGPLRLAEKGVVIDGGTLGTFTLTYPKVEISGAGQGKSETAMEQRLVDGSMVLTYPCGATLTVALEEGGKVAYRLGGKREAVRGLRIPDMIIPFTYSDGGTWRIGDGDVTPFPGRTPPKTHMYQGNADRFEFTAVDGRRISITVPPYSYQQLQDNRKWNWKVFAWWFKCPVQADADTYRLAVSVDQGSGEKMVLVDKFGQTTRKDFPGKVKDVAELKNDVADEMAFYDRFTMPDLDTFGGLAGSGEKLGLQRSGFFHVEQKDGRWVLVTPEGNACFHLGICSFGCNEDFTYIEGREEIYEWLPGRAGEFAAAYHSNSYWNPRAFSFYRANLIRKYGSYDDDAFAARMVDRVRRVGFNAVGAFSARSPAFREKHFPYVATLPLGEWTLKAMLPGVRGMFDPFDTAVLAKVDELFAKSLPESADDPLLIGYFLANEQGLEDIPRAVPKLDGKHACKQQLVAALRKTHATIEAFNAAWGTDAPSFESLADRGLPVTTKAAFADMEAFTEAFLDAYYKAVTEAFRKHDPNHMLLGNRWQPGTANSEVLCRVAGKYMDVISINYYTAGIDKSFVRRLYEWSGGRPQMWSEFFYTAERESNVGSREDLATQTQRGEAYRQYVEGAAALGFVVGVEWFTLTDQAATGRFFEKYNGERQNTGLFNVCDRPYKDLFVEMAKTHKGVYEVWLDGRSPFELNIPRFAAGAGKLNRVVSAGHATGAMTMDGLVEGWPGRPPERIGGDRIAVGREAGGLEASFKICWDDAALYLLVNVTDATPMLNTHAGNMLWSADGLELFLGSETLEQGGALLFSDKQILLGAGADGAKSHVVNSAKQPQLPATAIPAVDGKGYTLEASIPWSVLGVTPKEGTELLFDLAVDDSTDGKSRRCQLMWNGGPRNSSDRGAWGRLKLVR